MLVTTTTLVEGLSRLMAAAASKPSGPPRSTTSSTAKSTGCSAQ